MTSNEDILKLKQDIEWDMLQEDSSEIFESILKDLEELKQCVPYGRQAGKEIATLNQVLHKPLDKPILWVGTQDVGNKYIVPQKQFEKMQEFIKLMCKYYYVSISGSLDYHWDTRYKNENEFYKINHLLNSFKEAKNER